ncbi:hypothetical protein SK128_027917 [Halocaridina rubra]|uniref:Uncharacterized protein n=1 Tax=Halocaridina rubra TaxID=373956 RepID=A0AAN8WMU8_HALRR
MFGDDKQDPGKTSGRYHDASEILLTSRKMAPTSEIPENNHSLDELPRSGTNGSLSGEAVAFDFDKDERIKKEDSHLATDTGESNRKVDSNVAAARQDLVIDNDTKARKCTVYLYRRPLLTLLAYHWTLRFDWGDYEAYYEADDVDGYLLPNWGTGKPRDSENHWHTELGTVFVSPYVLNEKARSNKFNGRKYVLSDINCQVWASELSESLGLPILHRNFVDKIPFVRTLVNKVHESKLFQIRF